LPHHFANRELGIYTVVQLAKRDWVNGRFRSAFTRLRVDADKIRMHDHALYDVLCARDLPPWAVDKN